MPAFSCASSVEAPRCGVATTFSSSKSGRVGARLGGEDVEPGGGDATLLERGVQSGLVDDAAAGGVDEHQRRLDLVQLLGADQAGGLGRLRQVDRHEVGLGEQRVEVDESDAHLGGAAGLHVRVVGDHLHAEGAEPLRDEDADPTEADDADGLLVQLDAGVARPLPLAVLERGVRGRDVPRGREHQRDGELGGGDDVGGRCVHDHHAGHGRGAHVDVVEADAGAGDHLEPARGGERLGVHLGGGADQDRVHVADRREQVAPVGAVAVADLEVRAQRLDGGGAELFGDEYDWHGHSDGVLDGVRKSRWRTTLCCLGTVPDRPRITGGVRGPSPPSIVGSHPLPLAG